MVGCGLIGIIQSEKEYRGDTRLQKFRKNSQSKTGREADYFGLIGIHAFFFKKAIYKKVLLDRPKPFKNQESFSTCLKNLKSFQEILQSKRRKRVKNSKTQKIKKVVRKF